jgi:hypothetical protein
MALRLGLRRTGHRRHGVERLERGVQGVVRGHSFGLRQIGGRWRKQAGYPSTRWRRMAWARKPGCAGWRPARVSASHSPELQPAEHLWEFVDEPLVNTYFETIPGPGKDRQ